MIEKNISFGVSSLIAIFYDLFQSPCLDELEIFLIIWYRKAGRRREIGKEDSLVLHP